MKRSDASAAASASASAMRKALPILPASSCMSRRRAPNLDAGRARRLKKRIATEWRCRNSIRFSIRNDWRRAKFAKSAKNAKKNELGLILGTLGVLAVLARYQPDNRAKRSA